MAQAYLSPDLLAALRAVEEMLSLQDDLPRTLTNVSSATVRLIADCDSASVTMLENGNLETPGSSDERSSGLDRIQYDNRSGPCLQAVDTATKTAALDLENEDRWPEFSKAALEHGLMSVLSVPLTGSGISAALNLYSESPNAFKDAPAELTELLAIGAAVAIKNAKAHEASKHLVEQLKEAIATREIIGEAKGILMERESLSQDDAFAMLVSLSQKTNTKLREVAQKIVDAAERGNG